MSRSGLSEDCDEQWMQALWIGQVRNATRGKRGQKFYRELLAAFDAMPAKELHAEVFDDPDDGKVCALGVLARARGIDATKFDPDDDQVAEELACDLDVAPCLARTVIWENDEGEYGRTIWLRFEELHGERLAHITETPDQRWQRMRNWVAKQLKEDT